MARLLLSDDEWDLIKDAFPEPKPTGRPPVDRRQVMDGIFWILRTGSPWRDLPEEFGKWQTVWRLFDKWNNEGRLSEIVSRLQDAFIDVEQLAGDLWCVDGTVVRAARCCAGGAKKKTPTNQRITL